MDTLRVVLGAIRLMEFLTAVPDVERETFKYLYMLTSIVIVCLLKTCMIGFGLGKSTRF